MEASISLGTDERIARRAPLHPLGLQRAFLWKAVTSFLSGLRTVCPEGGFMARVSMAALDAV